MINIKNPRFDNFRLEKNHIREFYDKSYNNKVYLCYLLIYLFNNHYV